REDPARGVDRHRRRGGGHRHGDLLPGLRVERVQQPVQATAGVVDGRRRHRAADQASGGGQQPRGQQGLGLVRRQRRGVQGGGGRQEQRSDEADRRRLRRGGGNRRGERRYMAVAVREGPQSLLGGRGRGGNRPERGGDPRVRRALLSGPVRGGRGRHTPRFPL